MKILTFVIIIFCSFYLNSQVTINSGSIHSNRHSNTFKDEEFFSKGQVFIELNLKTESIKIKFYDVDKKDTTELMNYTKCVLFDESYILTVEEGLEVKYSINKNQNIIVLSLRKMFGMRYSGEGVKIKIKGERWYQRKAKLD